MLGIRALYQNQYEHNASQVEESKHLENLSSVFQDLRLFGNIFFLKKQVIFLLSI